MILYFGTAPTQTVRRVSVFPLKSDVPILSVPVPTLGTRPMSWNEVECRYVNGGRSTIIYVRQQYSPVHLFVVHFWSVYEEVQSFCQVQSITFLFLSPVDVREISNLPVKSTQ